VYVFSYHISVSEGDESRLEVISELEGKQVGEYFGAAVSVMDVNGDGVDDILVGAPHYGAKRTWDQGRLYVYITTVIQKYLLSFQVHLGSVSQLKKGK
jgi:hypothetical protein